MLYVLKAFGHRLDDELYAMAELDEAAVGCITQWRGAWRCAYALDEDLRAMTYWNGWPRWVVGEELAQLLGEIARQTADDNEVAAVDVDLDALGPIDEQPMECIQVWVERDGIYWRGYVENRENQVDTATLRWQQIKEAKCFTA
mgnify:CR=1 FL=1